MPHQLPEWIEENLHTQKSGCRLWYGPSEPNGYPFYRFKGEKIHMRRFIYELDGRKKNGPVRPSCGKVQCVAREHLV